MKNKKLIALIIGLLCVAFSVFGIIKATNTSFFKMPFFKLIAGMSNADIDEINESLEEAIERAEDVSDEEIEEFEDATNQKWEDVIAFLETPSINRLINIGESINEFDSSLDLGEGLEIFELFRNIILVYGIIIALFSLLGALLKKKVFPIIAIILSLGFYLAFVGVIFLILFIALSITHIVLLSKSKELPQIDPAQ